MTKKLNKPTKKEKKIKYFTKKFKTAYREIEKMPRLSWFQKKALQHRLVYDCKFRYDFYKTLKDKQQ